MDVVKEGLAGFNLSSKVARRLGVRKHLWKGASRRASQRKGHRGLSDEKLLDALAPNLVQTSRWCASTKRSLQTLMGSKRDVYSTTFAISSAMSYRRLCQRHRRAKLGVGKGSKRVDCCDYCVWFDNEVRPDMKKS